MSVAVGGGRILQITSTLLVGGVGGGGGFRGDIMIFKSA